MIFYLMKLLSGNTEKTEIEKNNPLMNSNLLTSNSFMQMNIKARKRTQKMKRPMFLILLMMKMK